MTTLTGNLVSEEFVETEFIKVKKILADFVRIKGTDFVNLFTNDDMTLINLLKQVDDKWVNATTEYDGLFSKEDKRLLLFLKEQHGLSFVNALDLSTGTDYNNINNIVIDQNSSITMEDFKKNSTITYNDGTTLDVIQQGVKLKVNDNIMKLLKFKSSAQSNVSISYDNNNHELLITQKTYEYVSEEYKTIFTLHHNLNTQNINTKVFVKDEDTGKWTDAYVKIVYLDSNSIEIRFTEATLCKIVISIL